MTPPPTMRCVEIARPGGPDVLRPAERPVPVPAADEVLIAVDHAGVNRPDALQRAGLYDPPPGASDLLGLECSGTVVAAGAAAGRWSAGDRVCALLPGGGYAQYAAAPADHCLPVPDGLSMAEAAALPETGFTVWSNLFVRGGLRAGERVLIHGGTSGIGTAAIAMARLAGARVWATAGSAEKRRVVEGLGAVALDYAGDGYVDALRAQGGAHLVLDMGGGENVARSLRLLAPDGRLVQIAFLSGSRVEVDLLPVMTRRLTATGSTLRPRSVAEKARLARALERTVWPWIAAGRMAPVMDEAFPLHRAAEAHARMEAGAHRGKIVLRVG